MVMLSQLTIIIFDKQIQYNFLIMLTFGVSNSPTNESSTGISYSQEETFNMSSVFFTNYPLGSW